MRPFLPACLALWLTVLVGCTTVPETGRRQIIAIPASQEAQLGASTFAQIRQEERISNNPRYNAQVQNVGSRIAAAVGREVPNAEWEFVVFDSDEVNAFALPGGKVGVYTGLLKLASSDDELATVIGHEIAHVTSRHGAERMTQGLGATAVGTLGSLVLGGSEMEPGTRQAVMAAYGIGATLGMNYYSRSHELEADTIGLRFAASAGYDPRAAAQFWRKMQTASERSAKPPEFMSTHPSDERRIANLEALAQEYLPVYEKARRQGGARPQAPIGVQPPIGSQAPIGGGVIGRD